MDSSKYSTEFLARIALSVLKKDKTVPELVAEHGIPEWALTEALVKIIQGAHTLTSETSIACQSLASDQKYGRNNNTRLCFIHLEKTAGTSLTSFLDDCYATSEICPSLLHSDLVNLASAHDLKHYSLLHGHFLLSWLNEAGLNYGNTNFITVLRHPLQRQISYYRHWMRAGSTSQYFSAFLVDHNLQCMRLSPLSTRRGYATTRNHLDAAKEALDKFFFVGIQERFEECIASLALLLGRPAQATAYSLNISTNDPPDLPAALEDEILTSNWADIELHEVATAIFERRFSSGVLKNEEKASAIFDWEIRNEVRYTLDQAIYGKGWYFREGVDGRLPQIWRWSGPGTESVVSFHLDSTRNYKLSVRIINSLSAEILDSLQVFVNEERIEVQFRTDELWGRIYEGIIPSAAFHSDAPNTNVIFKVSKTLQFNHVDPTSSDDRKCGIAVSEINILPIDFY